MKNTITIYLSPAGQAAAARAGLPAQWEQSYELSPDLIGRVLDLGATVEADGSVHADLTRLARAAYAAAGGAYTRHYRLDSRPADAAAAVAAAEEVCAAARAAAVREHEEEIAEARARIERTIAQEPIAGATTAYSDRDRELCPELAPAVATWTEARAAARADRLVAHEAAIVAYESGGADYPGTPEWSADPQDRRVRIERERREKAAVAERLARLAELVREHGEESARERLAAPGDGPLGLLPEDEAVRIVRDVSLPATIPGMRAYARGTDADVCGEDCDTCGGGNACASWLVHSPEEAGGVTAEEWGDLRALREAIQAAGLPAVEDRVHVGACAACEGAARRIGVRITRDLGAGVIVEREYQHA